MPIKGVSEGSYTLREYLAFIGATMLEDGKSVFVGTGLPILAASLAQHSHAPGLLLLFEAGGIGARLPEIPTSVGESRTYFQGIAASSMHDLMSLSQAGFVDYGFLGAAQIDPYGNINTTVIGEHAQPKVRLPGSGGGNDVACFSQQLITIISKQSKLTFVERLDFLTTAGYLDGPGARERAGLPSGTGPYRVITQLGVYYFDQATKRMSLFSIHPGVEPAEIAHNASFKINIPEEVPTSPEPSEEDLYLLREIIDPSGIARN